ncbi:MAG: ankyrin repeat domain-containing protein [Crocinitomicaceae bacterium]|nr:ankyrin repeat domain-containing protein [Crocinitomicaceae bacterium]
MKNSVDLTIDFNIPMTAKYSIRHVRILSCIFLMLLVGNFAIAQPDDRKDLIKLQQAILSESVEMVEQLISEGLKVNDANRWGYTPVHTAIESDQLDMLKLLIDYGANDDEGMAIAAKNRNVEMVKYLIENEFKFEDAVIYAAENNHFRMVRLLVEAGSEVEMTQKRKKGMFSSYYVTPIEFAVKNGNKEMVHFFVDYGLPLSSAAHECFDLSQIDILKSLIDRSNAIETMLEQAYIHENRPIIDYLITKGADLKILGGNDNTMLHISAEQSNLKLARLCIEEHGLDVNASNADGETPLMLAIKANNLELTRYLVDQGAEINTENNAGETAIFYTSRNSSDMFNYLVANEANLSHITKNRTTLLITASKNKHFEAVRYLIENGADITPQDADGFTAFHHVISPYDRDHEVIDMFTTLGADINTVSARDGKSLMYFAVEREDLDRVKGLLERGANINSYNPEGFRPRLNDVQLLKFLINNGGNINAVDRRNDSYLCMAIYENNLELIQFLIEKGIDVNQNCYFEEPPLVKAIEDDNIEYIKYLVEHGADVNAIGYNERNIMEYAEREENQEVITYLEEQGAMTVADKNALYKRSIKMESDIKIALATKNEAYLVGLLKKVDGLIIQDRLVKQVALFSAEEGNPIVMELIIQKFDYDLENTLLGKNQTALTIATINNETSFVSYLIGKGANVQHIDSDGKFPADYVTSDAMKKIYADLVKDN